MNSTNHYEIVATALMRGRVIPFLGAGANLYERNPDQQPWTRDSSFLPSGQELARHLATEVIGVAEDEVWDLAGVSQRVVVQVGSGPLYDALRGVFEEEYPPTPLHQFFARVPRLREQKGMADDPDPHRDRLLIITTNYDDLMESAFAKAQQAFHLISYIAQGDKTGHFRHFPPGGRPSLVIESANEYDGLVADSLPIVLKIHGAVNREEPAQDSYVITEDHYIDYLTRTDISILLPHPIPGMLNKSHLLFLGYGLRDWNLRVMLYRIWGEQELTYSSWAVVLEPDALYQKYWNRRNVEIRDQSLQDYISNLKESVEDWDSP